MNWWNVAFVMAGCAYVGLFPIGYLLENKTARLDYWAAMYPGVLAGIGLVWWFSP